MRAGTSRLQHSPMLHICLQGKDSVPFLEKLVVGDIQSVKNGSGTLSVFTNEKGGIIDDTVITKVSVIRWMYHSIQDHACVTVRQACMAPFPGRLMAGRCI